MSDLHPKLAGVDLNLLVALHALLQERNVTRAAARVGLSQPAMSRALGRLRDLLQDPLLVREGARMRATPRAEALQGRVQALMRGVQEVLQGAQGFDPATDRRTFTLASNDYCGAVVLPALVRRLQRSAPHVNLRVRALVQDTPVQGLASGALDAALGTFVDQAPGLERRTVFEDGFVCVVRKDHPVIRGRLTLKRYAEASHILVSAPGEGPGMADVALAAHGLSRRVAVRVPHFLVAPGLVGESDHLLTLAGRLAERATVQGGLRIMRPPLELPRFTVELLWHPRVQADPAIQWFLKQIMEVAGGL